MEGSHQKHRSWQAGPLPLPCPSPSPASISAPHWVGGNLRPSAPSNSEMGQAGSCCSLLIPSGRQITISFSCSHLAVAALLLLPLGQGLSSFCTVFLLTPHPQVCSPELHYMTLHPSLSVLSPSSLGSVSIFMTAFYNPEQTNADSVFLLISFALIISWSYNLCFLGEGGSWF